MLRSTIAILFFLLTIPALSHALTGKVISVADGDTITILDSSNRQHKIRLYGIDTPEKKQDFGKTAKKYTASLTAGKKIKVTAYDTDRYGRTVGVVEVNGLNVNRKLIESGYAWQYRRIAKSHSVVIGCS